MKMMLKCFFAVLLGVGLLGLLGCGRADQRAIKRGLRAIEQKEYDKALLILSGVLEAYPEHAQRAELLNYVGLVHWHQEHVQEANDLFHASLEANPDLFAPAYNLGLLFIQAGDVYQGAAFLQDAALMEEDARPLEMLAAEYIKREDWPHALKALGKAIEQHPESPRLETYLAVAGLKTEGVEFAESALKRAIKLDGEYAPALFNLGVLYEKWHGEPKEAIVYYEQYLDVEKDEIRRKLISAGVSKLVHEEEARAKKVMEAPANNPMHAVRSDVAETPALKVMTPVPVVVAEVTDEGRVDALLAKAVEEIRGGASSRAMFYCLQAAAEGERLKREDLRLKALRSAVSLLPEQARAHFALGRYLNDGGECSQAVESFQRCVALNPAWAQGHLSLAESAITCHEYQVALEALRRAVELEPGNQDAQWALVLFYDSQIKLPERALSAYRRFMDRFPEDVRSVEAGRRVSALSVEVLSGDEGFDVVVEATPIPGPRVHPKLRHSLTAITPVRTKRTSDKMPFRTLIPRSGDEGVRVRPASEAARSEAVQRYNQGTVQQREGQFNLALQFYQQAVEVDPAYAPPFYNMGVIYQTQHKLQLAMQAYRSALRSRPDLVNARYNLGLILKDLKQHREAIKELERVLQFNRNHAPSHFALGLIYEKEGGVVKAGQHYQRFLSLAPTDAASPRVRRWLSKQE